MRKYFTHLCLSLLASMISTTAWALEPNSDGIYEIANKDDFKYYKKMSSKEMFNRGFDVWGAEENYFKEDKKTGAVEIISFQKDGTVIHDHVDENGEEDLKEYKSREEFMKEFESSKEDKKTETKEEK